MELIRVLLSQVADYRVSTFSGGMKRRLSVALSFLGDPKIMFLGKVSVFRFHIWHKPCGKTIKITFLLCTLLANIMDTTDFLKGSGFIM